MRTAAGLALAALFAATAFCSVGAQDLIGGGNGTAPNFVLLSHDDALTDESYQLMLDSVLKAGDFKNPDGCRIPVTWFVGKQGERNAGDCSAAQAAYNRGHELASHTLSHDDNFENFTVEQLVADIEGVRVWLNDTCGIPKDVITGFRAPDFATSDNLGQALKQLGIQYDSSVQELNYKQPPGRLDDPAYNLKCKGGVCLNWKGLPFWEVPTYGLEPPAGRRTNPGDFGGLTAFQRLQNDVLRKRGSGVPTSIMAHRPYLADPTQRDDVVQFLGWATAEPNTWFVTYQQLIRYMEAREEGATIEQVMEEYKCDEE